MPPKILRRQPHLATPAMATHRKPGRTEVSGTFPGHKRYLALSVILSWRVFYLARLGRKFPDIDCEAMFEPSEWKAVYQVTQRRHP